MLRSNEVRSGCGIPWYPISMDPGPHSAQPGYAAESAEHLRRLHRIEGQVRGLARMVEDQRYCIDILTQISSVTRALQGVAIGLLDGHLHHCVAEALAEGGPGGMAKVTEATRAIERLVRS